MKNTRYVKVQVSFVLCYDEPLDVVPEELAHIEPFLTAGVQAAFVAKNRPNRVGIYICPYAKLNASLIHSPRGLPQFLAQAAEGMQTFLTRKQLAVKLAREQEAEAKAAYVPTRPILAPKPYKEETPKRAPRTSRKKGKS